ncbi:hypothetical protein KUV44_06715 [Marinobacter daepoensis]|uniref:NACHT domain-containing protein n=1 Tax=Marinobacter daepoensis TaxID=262077 RepID=A0ABS3BL57_9GAMM|nr:hypothetical protein [Marinobacter daepoensis]MBN7770960.1 hypothetical protein [Marinobacter daepoensis]MBY6078822.1 hypothetical protein [Marinobacter daepoensis]
MSSWKNLEEEVKQYAQYIWNRKAEPDRLAGINFDCVLTLSEIEKVIVEVTENRSLDKIRGDIARIQIIRTNMMAKNIMVRPYIVCDFQPTQGMKDAGKESYVEVLSFSDFRKIFFDFDTYKHVRSNATFGSAVDPITGENDEAVYTPVGYDILNSVEANAEEIAQRIIDGKKVILLGDYGTGKSRCFREVFNILARRVDETFLYPIAIDLKETWGLESSVEIIRRHFNHLGIGESETDSVVKAFNGKRICFLLDGFDELGSRPWSEDKKKLESIRRHALQGVKDLLSNAGAGFLVSGREHYFNSNKEMMTALGVREDQSVIARCKTEFSYEEFYKYLELNNINVSLPSWLPRKPLILKTIASLDNNKISELFNSSNGDEIEFWYNFIDAMCERDSRIHPILDPDTVKQVLSRLASLTRERAQNVGPITESEVVDVFFEVTGSYPNEQSTVMLQRLPGLGRVSSETGDRNFVDDFVLDGLRALDLVNRVSSSDRNVSNLKWLNPLRKLGVSILSREMQKRNLTSLFITYAKQSLQRDKSNKVSISDVLSALNQIEIDEIDFDGFDFIEAHFGDLNFERANLKNIKFSDGVFESITLGKVDPESIVIKDSFIDRLLGVSSSSGVPAWIKNCEVVSYESIDTLTAIKKSGLTDEQTMLVSILIKVYRQAGNGRLEHTLTKGLAAVNKKSLKKILQYLISNGFLVTSKDNGETIYKPVRKHQERIEKILNELDRSNDEVWEHVTMLSA